jgi:hypothetical protein
VEDGHLPIKSIEIVAETSFAGWDYAEKHPGKGSYHAWLSEFKHVT